MAQNLTVKQRRFVSALVEHGNATQAAIDAGYEVQDRMSAKVIASQNLDKPNIRTALDAALSQRGLDETAIVQGLARLLESENLAHVARGVELLLKIRGDAAPKRSMHVRMSYAERIREELTRNDQQN